MRVAHVNMSQDGTSCPQELTQKNMSGLTLCGHSATGCRETLFSALGLSYSRVCGRLRGYQFATPDGFAPYNNGNNNVQLNQGYVDGVSITYGTASPKHIWTYVVGYALTQLLHACPCNSGGTAYAPPYVGNDYYCETGNNAASDFWGFLPNDPLWDGQQCDGVEAPCCTHPNMPWFIKTLGETTTEDIQLRLCIDEALSNEQILLQLIELYVY